MITQDRLMELLDYDSNTGKFIWRGTRRVKAGDNAGTINHDGYIRIKIDNRLYMAHRLAWLYVYGQWPANTIDHINRIRSDNRIENLRDVTHRENMNNTQLGLSGHRNVYLHTQNKNWVVRIRRKGKQIHCGSFDNLETAKKVADQERDKLLT